MSIYEKVKSACAESKISIYALEVELGFPRSSICKWNKSVPGVDKISAVAKSKTAHAVDKIFFIKTPLYSTYF